MDVIEELYGPWRLEDGGAVDPVPPEYLGEASPGWVIRDDGRTNDRGRLVRFTSGGVAGLGLVEVEVGGDTTARGLWRASPAGAFLAEPAGGNGTLYGEFRRPRPWLRDAARVDVEQDTLTLWNAAGEPLARLQRVGGWALRRASPTPTAGAEAARAVGLPPGIDAVTHEQLLGAWECLIAPSPPWPPGWRWQNIEFTDDGQWRAFPLVNMGSGRWRHEPDGTLLALSGSGMTQRMVTGWVDLYPWLFPVARAGFDQRDQLVLLDDTNHELQRLQRMASDSSGAASSDQQ